MIVRDGRIGAREEHIRLPEQLEALGFTARHHPDTGALAIIPPMRRIPAGAFLMGSDPSRDPKALPNEFPQHTVYLPAYYIGRYPVTVAEYACALEAGAADVEEPVNWSRQHLYLTHPVDSLTWYDTLAYTRWLSEFSGLNWRLPSEAEWEKAARGIDGRIYPWGDTWDPMRANGGIAEDTGATDQATPPESTTAIDAYPPGASPYGLLDMVGNICEWTSTIYDEGFNHPYQPGDGREDSQAQAPFRMMRGGCWLLPPKFLRAARRDVFSVDDRFDWLHGMRLALSGDPGELSR